MTRTPKVEGSNLRIAVLVGSIFLLLIGLVSAAHAQAASPDLPGFLESLGAGWAVPVLGVFWMVINLAGKSIPDSATGLPGTIRKICKFLVLYRENKK